MNKTKLLSIVTIAVASIGLFGGCGVESPESVADSAVASFYIDDCREEENYDKLANLIHSDMDVDSLIDQNIEMQDELEKSLKDYVDMGAEEEVDTFLQAYFDNVEVQRLEVKETKDGLSIDYKITQHMFDTDNMGNSLGEALEQEPDDEEAAAGVFIEILTEELESKEFSEDFEITVELKKDGKKWKVINMY